ncbi:hypothetical protein Rhe02_11670 [Rhizocola hellebori]|uniref:Alkaline shock response membrane anchor protein AmaP n=1 Tax=Rhizocola hellebori TaxID=1392758 RepID=A0A8J3VDX6_9ACTN|nr:alkaline shock response membrane anchor protein AmaP [Rhizocola hellebori]GIH03100.1 hypothetical protein Rhe02_11670 [Rhizocola hellebori]
MHADRTNRILLLLLGLLLTAAGVAGLLAGSGAFGSALADRTLADSALSRYFGDNGRWLWPVAAAVAVIVLLLVLRWLFAVLFSTDRVRVLALHTDRATDRTTLAAPAVARAVRGEIEGYHSVRAARVWLIGDPEEPRMAVTVDVDGDADLGALRDRIEHGALAHARHALDRPDLPIRLDLELTRQQPARVA